uniref:Reverse transcriptase domain-containing protein n=1 Tax=Musa acuminata subsp. malaccensis TaxID=214687 RepID=A0A804JL91_MUSAM|nr:PREDICTED: uncharacterized protein LOC103989797 [Musa acuminata subsp. malaccensis]
MHSGLTGFTGDSISPLGAVTLPITLGVPPRSKTVMSTFLVVDLPTAYNAILGRPTLNKIRAVVSTYHQTVKFSTHAEAGEVWGSPRETKQCYLTTVSLHKRARTEQPPGDPREMKKPTPHPEPTAPTCDVPLMKDRLDRTIRIGSELPEQEREQLVGFLQENADVFAWSPSDMTGVDLKTVGKSWDCYPLPRIDQFVDATAGHARLSFMDAFSGYNQIRMAPEDQEDTAFLTDRGAYFYKVMSFGLKNTGATYQRIVNKMFAQQIGLNIEVYVDDMIMKSRATADHLTDLAETFATLRRYGLRLNHDVVCVPPG